MMISSLLEKSRISYTPITLLNHHFLPLNKKNKSKKEALR
jgi:hypothetical protein